MRSRRSSGRPASSCDIDRVPLDDPKTYEIFQEGQTYGIFQFESSGMRDILRKARPERLEDLIALNALYRPGPLRSGMVDDFIARKQGKVEIKYELAELEPILRDTYGVIAYQEQVIRIARDLADFTLGEADILRKAMGKKKADVMQAQRAKFVEGAKKRGIQEKKATHIFDLMEHFAGYGFPKAHATAYALLAYQTAYLKANYPWHFAAALLTIEAQNADKLALYLGECRERGIPLLPADINQSELRFTVEIGAGVRFGLTAIKNVGEGAIASLLEVRKIAGTDHVATCALRGSRSAAGQQARLREPRRRPARSTRWPAAARRWSRSRRPSCARGSSRRSTRRASTVRAISGTRMKARRTCLAPLTLPPAPICPAPRGTATGLSRSPRPRPGPSPSSSRSRRRRSACTGAATPWTGTRSSSKRSARRSTSELADMPVSVPRTDTWGPGGPKPIEPDTTIGGIVAACRQLKTRKGDRMAVFTLEDADGGIEVIVFPETYQRSAALIETGTMVLVRGKLERDDETVRILASEIVGIDSVRERSAREVAIRLKKPAGRGIFEALGEVFARHRGDRRVSFEIELPSTPTPPAGEGGPLGTHPRQAFADTDRGARADRGAGVGVATVTLCSASSRRHEDHKGTQT